VKASSVIASVGALVGGAAILIFALVGGSETGAYGTGHFIATVFAIVLVFAGVRGLRRALDERES
jgi:peptidoglycan/LPS O-acetylase OafA/YrhL